MKRGWAATTLLVVLTATACSTHDQSANAGTPPAPWAAAAPHAAASCGTNTVRPGAWKSKPVDFNGDGRPDLAIGSAMADVGPHKQAGRFSVVYGKAGGGLDLAHHVTYDENSPGIAGHPSVDAGFSEDLATDVDGDGYTDLIVGGKLDLQGTWTSTILWGGPDGLHDPTVLRAAPTGTASPGVNTAGDFNGDGRTDLVSGNTILYGVGRDGRPAWVGRIPSHLEGAFSSTAGDVNGDGITDLVTLDGQSDDDSREYTAYLFLGGAHGLTPAGVLKSAYGHDLTGETAAIGDLNGDGCGDIVVGQTGYSEDDGKLPQGGGLGIVYGGPNGVGTQPPVWISQSTPGIDQHGVDGDDLGASLTVSDLDGDGCADILASMPGKTHGKTHGNVGNYGSFLVLRGSAHGVSGHEAQLWDQSSAGIPIDTSRISSFGADIAVLGGTTSTSTTRVVVAGGGKAGGLLALMRTGPHGLTTSGMTTYTTPWIYGASLNNTTTSEG